MENIDGMTQPITPILKKMGLGEVRTWPVERGTSISVSIGRLHREMRREGVRFSMKTKGLVVEVTRTA